MEISLAAIQLESGSLLQRNQPHDIAIARAKGSSFYTAKNWLL
jgi:hypothetical protein